MPLIETKGAASAQGFGEFAQSAAVNYIEDVFSTYLYTGNGSTQTITNGIDLSGKGGMVWFKSRSNVSDHRAIDTVRGATKDLRINTTDAQATTTNAITSFNSDGFSLGSAGGFNNSGYTFASWTFRKQAKFFDVVTYTGNGSASARQIAHSLASAPGCVIVKRTDSTGNWWVGHRSAELSGGGNPASTSANFALNTTNTYSYTGSPYSVWAYGSTSSNFLVNDQANLSGVTYVAYLFAHDAGGFGLSGTDNVISCGSYTNNGSGNATVNLGWEPQFVILKNASGTSSWLMYDNMREMPVGTGDRMLAANNANAEITNDVINPTATGFDIINSTPYATYIYIAIRRGPMRVPTSGTSVFTNTAYAGNFSTQTLSGFGFPPDLSILKSRNQGYPANVYDRLRGSTRQLVTPYDSAESLQSGGVTSFDQNGITMGSLSQINTSAQVIGWSFRRAPGFFDEVCYTGNGVTTGRAINHNLGAAPELIVVKSRNSSGDWATRCSYITSPNSYVLNLNNATAASIKGNYFQGTPTQTTFTVGYDATVNNTGTTYAAYLFATLAGVSKVGSYTGSGTTKQIDCGFAAGARFVLIKRTDSTGDWYVYDSARGIVAGNDPYLFLNSADSEVTGTDYVDTYSAGFELSSTAPAGLNANGGTYIFLAIA